MANFPSQQSGKAPRGAYPKTAMGLQSDGFPEVTHQKKRCQLKFRVRHKCHHNESRGSTIEGDNLECSVRQSQTTLPLRSFTPVSTDSRIIEHSFQVFYSKSQPVTDSHSMTTLPQKQTRCLQKNMKTSRFLVFNAIQNVKSTSRRNVLPKEVIYYYN